MIVARGEFKGNKMIYIYKSQEDADRAAEGEQVYPAFSCGVRKAEAILSHISDIAKFVLEEGQLDAKINEELDRLNQVINPKE